MLAVGIAAIVIAVIFLFAIPWVGIAVGIVGVVLLGLYALGAARRATEPRRT